MKRYKIVFSYDGSNFMGYQKQKGLRTVQGIMEYILSKLDYKYVKIHASGRTDKGVHALNQVAHFDILRNSVSIENINNILISELPNDICIKSLVQVNSDFHARYSVRTKEYIFKIKSLQIHNKDAFNYRYYTYIDTRLNITLINKICNYLIGTHDFTSFCCNSREYNCVRTLSVFRCVQSKECYIFILRADGFLTYMVRILVAFVITIHNGDEKINKINELFLTKDKIYVNKKLPSQGLYLKRVFY